MIISKTPLRISFAGGGTDLPSYYKYNEFGAVLSASINSYLYVTVKEQSPLFGGEYRLNYSETELVKDLELIKNPIIRECIRFLEIDEKLYIGTTADAPASSGLGSSSSFCVGLLNALYKFKNESISLGRLAEEASHIECDILLRPMGKQDQYAAAYGGINYIRFNDDESVELRPVNMNSKNLKLLANSALLFWTGISRPSESVLTEQDEKNKYNEDTLCLMRGQALELVKTLIDPSFSIEKLGLIIDQGWSYKKQLSSNVSNKKINDYYSMAKSCGALGGKISGAGGGGFILIIAEKSSHTNIIQKMATLGLIRYKFGLDSLGSVVYEIN